MVRGSMTRSSIAAAVVVALLFGLLIWWRDEHSGVTRTTRALTPPLGAPLRAAGEVRAVPAARPVPPAAVVTVIEPGAAVLPYAGVADAGAPASR
jgi:hypothetical protein